MKQNLLLIISVIILVAAIYYHLNKETVQKQTQNDNNTLTK